MTIDTILINDIILGNITIGDLLNYLDYLITQNKECQEILNTLLKNSDLTDDDIVSILNKFDFEYNIQFIKEVLISSLN